MKREVKNDKVLRAITIGLATMIAATSMPVNVWADGDAETPVVEGDNENNGGSGNEEGSGNGEETGSGEQQAAEINNEVATANASAEALVPSNPAPTGGDVSSDVTYPEGSIPAAVDAVDNLLVTPAEGQTPEQTPQLHGVTDALEQLGVVSDKVVEVKGDLADIKNAVAADAQMGAAPIGTEYSVPSAEGDSEEKVVTEGKEILVLYTSENEDKPEYYDNNTPVVGGKNVDYYDQTKNGTDFYNPANEDDEQPKPFIKSIVEDYTNAVDSYLAGNTDANLAAAFDAAAEADRKLTIEENKIKALDEAIKDSRAADEALKSAKEDLETVKTIKTKYDAVMTRYFRELISDIDKQDVFNDDGSINAQKCVDLLKKRNNYSEENKQAFETVINTKADDPKGTLTGLARDLFRELVKEEIKKNGGTEISFDFADDEKKKTIEKNKDDKITTEATIVGNVFLNGKGHFQVNGVGAGVNDSKNGDVLYKVKGDAIGGRNNRFAVSYIPKGGTEEDRVTAYFNYVYKSTKVDNGVPRNDTLDIENGILYLSKVEKNTEGKWVATDVETHFDDYSLYASGGLVDAAVKAVEAAEKNSADLKNAVNSIRNSILGVTPLGREEFSSDEEYNTYLEGFNREYDTVFNELKVAAKYSRVKLNALIELIGPRPIMTPTDTVDDDDDDDDDTTGGDEDPGTGGPVYDLGTGTLTIPGYEIPPITLPTTPSGVAGVRAAATRPSGVLGVKAPETKAEKTIANKTVVKPAANKTIANKTNKKGTKIEDPIVPLADTPFEDSTRLNWGWLLIIFLLGATGKKLYDEYKKKQEEANAAKSK